MGVKRGEELSKCLEQTQQRALSSLSRTLPPSGIFMLASSICPHGRVTARDFRYRVDHLTAPSPPQKILYQKRKRSISQSQPFLETGFTKTETVIGDFLFGTKIGGWGS